MVMALHRPSSLNSNASADSLAILYRSSSLSVNLFHHSASRKQLNIHWINLYRAFTSCAILIYTLRQHQTRPDLETPTAETITTSLKQCREIIALFRGVGTLMSQYSQMPARIIEAFETQPPTMASPTVMLQNSLFATNQNETLDQISEEHLAFDFDTVLDSDASRETICLSTHASLARTPKYLPQTYWMEPAHASDTRFAESDEPIF